MRSGQLRAAAARQGQQWAARPACPSAARLPLWSARQLPLPCRSQHPPLSLPGSRTASPRRISDKACIASDNQCVNICLARSTSYLREALPVCCRAPTVHLRQQRPSLMHSGPSDPAQCTWSCADQVSGLSVFPLVPGAAGAPEAVAAQAAGPQLS